MSGAPVVVVGAGPTGLAAACALRQQDVEVVVLERKPTIDLRPKAVVLWSGALEALQRLGQGDSLRELGLPLDRAEYLSGARRVLEVELAQVPDTDFPGPLALSQPTVERLLGERLRQLGGVVRRGTSVRGLEQFPDGVRVSTDAGTIDAGYVIGADGTDSRVRRSIGVTMDGHTFPREFVMADGRVEGAAPDTATYRLSPAGVLVVVPLAEGGHRVFLDLQPTDGTAAAGQENPESVIRRALADRDTGLRLVQTRWSSRFHVQTRIASRFRQGRVFLAGDAAHTHSPAGGQGLNTGVQDGFDLAWRCAAVLHGAHPDLLLGYEAERRPVALRALRHADAQTRMWLLEGTGKRLLRDGVLRAAGKLPRARRSILGRLAQLELDLRESPALVSAVRARGERPVGSRAAAADRASGTVHRLLLSGDRSPVALGARPLTEVRVRPSVRAADPATLTWVRPDGVIGGRVSAQRSDDLLRLLPSA